jgi:hypothetical protein
MVEKTCSPHDSHEAKQERQEGARVPISPSRDAPHDLTFFCKTLPTKPSPTSQQYHGLETKSSICEFRENSRLKLQHQCFLTYITFILKLPKEFTVTILFFILRIKMVVFIYI